MKKISLMLFFVLAMSLAVFAQSQFPEFDKAQKVKLLNSTFKDLRKIFPGEDLQEPADDHDKLFFSTKNARIDVTLSDAGCSSEYSFWNVPKQTITNISIEPIDELDFAKLKLDTGSFKKEVEDDENPEIYSLISEAKGIFIKIEVGNLQKIILFPSKDKIGFLCHNENTEEIFSTEKRLIDVILENESIACRLFNSPPDVTDLVLDLERIFTTCDGKPEDQTCFAEGGKINVKTIAVDAENDVLVYDYLVTGGKIEGRGASVFWDMTGEKPGTYTITARVDDGTGYIGKALTKVVDVVK